MHRAACAQPFVSEGLRDRYKTAYAAFVYRGEQFPRLIMSKVDYLSGGLDRVAPGSQGVYGPVIRQFAARSVPVIPIKRIPRTRIGH